MNVASALQGGGSHGAFTWEVLDRLLEDPRFGIEAISGASAAFFSELRGVALAAGFDAFASATPRACFRIAAQRISRI